MASVCYNNVMQTTYQEIVDSVIKGCNGSFQTFPENGQLQLFITPSGVGGCATDIRNGILFAGSDVGNFIIDAIGIKMLISSWAPTVTNGNGEVALGFNAADGPVILALAQAIVYTGFLTVNIKKTTELCIDFARLKWPGLYVEMAAVQDGCSEPSGAVTNDGCLCPFVVHAANGGPDSKPMKAPHAMVLSNTSAISMIASFSSFADADSTTCLSALDMAAISGSEQTCVPDTTCPTTKLSSFSGLVEVVDVAVEGLACVSLC